MSCRDDASSGAIKVPSLRLERILAEAGVSKVDALKIDVEGFEDRVLTGFFRDAPQALWPRAVVIEHLSKQEWLTDCIADMLARGYLEAGKTRSNTFLLRGESLLDAFLTQPGHFARRVTRRLETCIGLQDNKPPTTAGDLDDRPYRFSGFRL